MKDDAAMCMMPCESESEKTRLVNSVKLIAPRICESKVSSGVVCSASVIEEKRQYAKLKLSRKRYLDELSCSPYDVTSSQGNESTTCMGLFENESQSDCEKTRLLDGVKVMTSYICESKIPSDVCSPSVIEAKRQYAKLKLAQKRYLDGLSCSPNSVTSSQESM